MAYKASNNTKSKAPNFKGDNLQLPPSVAASENNFITLKKASIHLEAPPIKIKQGSRGPDRIELLAQACTACDLKIEYQKVCNERGYWQEMHHQALTREAKLKEEVEELKAKLRLREHQLFGRKNEQAKKSSLGNELDNKEGKNKRKRGQQQGKPGHGRRKHKHLPGLKEEHDFDEDKKRCPRCELPYIVFPKTQDSYQIVVEVKAHRRVIRRKQYQPSCACDCNPGIITVPGPGKLIPKGLLDVSTWVLILLDKFLYYRPTNRLLEQWKSYGVCLSQGTVTDGMKRLLTLLEPVEQQILAVHWAEDRWCADETRWMVYASVEGKAGYRWYLWIFKSPSSVVYKLDPSRSAKVPQEMLGRIEEGILLVDRYSAYKVLQKKGKIVLAFCWAHVRRDFLDLARDRPPQEAWAMKWVKAIGNLYYLNELRLSRVEYEQDYLQADKQLRIAINRMYRNLQRQQKRERLHPASKKVLKSLQNHWQGLTVFVDHPDVDMDNNESERLIRGPVVGRKMYYGSGSVWSGLLAARMFTLLQTLILWDINPRLWLTWYLESCAELGGNPPSDAGCFLPWNMSDKRRTAMSRIEPKDTS